MTGVMIKVRKYKENMFKIYGKHICHVLKYYKHVFC